MLRLVGARSRVPIADGIRVVWAGVFRRERWRDWKRTVSGWRTPTAAARDRGEVCRVRRGSGLLGGFRGGLLTARASAADLGGHDFD
jgi:hypothetical protein